MRTPYNKSLSQKMPSFFARRGYVACWQDVRGRFASEGEWARSCLDRWVREEIVQKGSPLHGQDLAELVTTHFSDVLQQTKDRDAARRSKRWPPWPPSKRADG